MNCCSILSKGFPGSSAGKESTSNAGDPGLIPGVGRSPEGGHCHPPKYSCLGNPMDTGAWRATVHGTAESNTTEQLSTYPLHACLFICRVRGDGGTYWNRREHLAQSASVSGASMCPAYTGNDHNGHATLGCVLTKEGLWEGTGRPSRRAWRPSQ